MTNPIIYLYKELIEQNKINPNGSAYLRYKTLLSIKHNKVLKRALKKAGLKK